MIDLVNNAGRTLLFDGLAQNDVDMNFHKLLNLDTSNLVTLGAPPTVHPPANQWLHDWDNATHTWTSTQPSFSSLSGNLSLSQQAAIIQVGTLSAGRWQASVIGALYLPRLDQIQLPGADLNLNSWKITNLATPVNPGDAVNLGFMDSLLQGLNPKPSVKVASIGPLPFVGQNPIDGIPIAANDRVLAKNESARPYDNGIWIVTSSGHWTRATDCSDVNPASPGTNINRAYCFVEQGVVNGNTSWVESNVVNTLGVDPVAFVKFSVGTSGTGPPGPAGPGVPVGGTTHQILRKIDGTDYNTEWADPGSPFSPVYAILQTGQASPVGTVSTTGKMMGLAGYFTCATSGKVVVTIAGFMYNNNAAGGAVVKLCAGLGTAPGNGANQPSGSALIGAVEGINAIGQNKTAPFSISAVISGLSIGVPIWFDLLLTSLTTGTAVVAGVSITAYEIP